MQLSPDKQPTHKHTHLQATQSRHTNQSLQKSVLLANAGQTTEKGAAGNKVLPKAGLNGFDWASVQGSTFVLRLNFSAKNPHLRQYPKRYLQADLNSRHKLKLRENKLAKITANDVLTINIKLG